MAQASARVALRSSAPVVLVEAPAGCGKTHEAAEFATESGKTLEAGQEVLLLAHTNAAVNEFRARPGVAGSHVRATTFDSFALELVGSYAAVLGLPTPLRMGGSSEVEFAVLAEKAIELFGRAPSLNRIVTRHYPVIVLDEHQDSRAAQHGIAERLWSAGASRLRIFGDPMQAIYGFDEEEAPVAWEALRRRADICDELDEPRRWGAVPELGAWILEAREALRCGGVLPITSAPSCVKHLRVPGLTDVRNPGSKQPQPAIIPALYRLLPKLEGNVALLARYNAHVFGLRVALKRLVTVNEGSEYGTAYEALEAAKAAVGNPRELALAAIELLRESSTGLTGNVQAYLARCLLPDRIAEGRSERVNGLLRTLRPLYESPDVQSWCKVVDQVRRDPPDWLTIHLPENLKAIGQVRIEAGQDSREALDRVVAYRKVAAPIGFRCVSTIHKAKGREFDHVIIAYASRTPFPNTVLGRRLLYVALSRARRTITIVAPRTGASELLG